MSVITIVRKMGATVFSLVKGLVSLALSIAAFFTKNLTLIVISIPIALVSLAHTMVFAGIHGYGFLASGFSFVSFGISIWALKEG
jgi:hypothetical protein